MGSHLSVPHWADENAGEEVWPPTMLEVILKDYKRFDLLMRPVLEAPAIIGTVAICDFYGGILGDLDRIAHGRRMDDRLPDAEVERFPYDWRLDLHDVAWTLSARLYTILQDDPSARFTLIAHSMGGLLARYMLEAPDFANEPWHDSEKLVRLITIATPHEGSPLALDRILGGSETLGISAEQFMEFAAAPEFPSGYQLVPGEDAGFVRDETEGVMVSKTINPFADDFAQAFDLVQENIEANRRLRAGLSLDRAPCDYFFFAGTGQKTRTGMRRIGVSVEAIFDQTGGDETVPSFSASTHRVPTRFVKATHVGILQNLAMRRTLFELLGAPRDLRPISATGADTGDAPIEDISVPTEPVTASPEEGADPASAVSLTINLRAPLATFEDRLRFEPVTGPETDLPDRIIEARREEHDIRYQGPELDSLTITVPAPVRAGIYTVGFIDSATDNPTPPRIVVARRP